MDRTWQNLTDPIMRSAAERPNAVALVEGRQSLSYGDLGALMRRATMFLRRNGVTPGARTGIAMANGIDHAILLLAIMRMGAVPVELPAGSGAASILAAVRKYRLAAVVTDPDIELGGAPETIHIRIHLDTRAAIAALPADEGAAAGLDALTIITLSSGSTGIPAGFVTTHRQMLRCIEIRSPTWRAAADGQIPLDVLLVASLRYSYFFHCFLTQLYRGGTLVLLPEYAQGIDLLRAIAAYPGALCFGTANICRFLLSAAAPGKLLLPDLARFECAGQPLSGDEKRAFAARVTPNFADNYGAVGIGTISIVTARDIAAKAETVGRPVAGVEVQIVDTNGRALPPGHVGRLRCRGEGMGNGPCPEDAANASAEYFRDGWFYPGDLAAMDGDGYLVLKGRASDIVRRQGAEIFSSEIEAALLAHPTVRDVAVISRPSAKLGEELVAFVVSGAEPRHEELARHCRMSLPPDRWPDHVFYIDVLPRNAAGKIERQRLRALAEARLASAMKP